jgi:hypothetical protein
MKKEQVYKVVVVNNPSVYPTGRTEWYNESGILHREDGPAVEFSNGEKRWYINGKLHRTDGPALIHENGDMFWYFEGKFHRENGPAIETKNGGSKDWYLNGKLHRTDGPAVIYAVGNKLYNEWYINGRKCPPFTDMVVIRGIMPPSVKPVRKSFEEWIEEFS